MKKIIIFIVGLFFTYSFLYAYTPGEFLLQKDDEECNWGQSRNGRTNLNESCFPSYNYFCPTDDDESHCGHTLAGCAAIAMAQIMYRWGYPEKSKYNSYNWNNIPPVLTDGCSDDCPRLIHDCGLACNMHYQTFAGIHITGSWTTSSNVVKGFADFDYGAYLYDIKDWKFGSAWADLIRSEIDCGRPVLMYGQHNIIEIKEKHYFVIDGYSKEDKDQFHVNWGWRGYKNGFYDLEKCGYSNGQELIVGIAPKYTGTPHAQISFSEGSEVLTPKCQDGANDKLQYKVNNADSYECHIYDRTGKKIWACAGLVKDGYADSWDGSSSNPISTDTYYFTVVFKNNFGDRVETSGSVLYFNRNCPPGTTTDSQNIESDSDAPTIFPNYTEGVTYIISNSKILSIEIIGMNAKVLLSEKPNSNVYKIDTERFGKGLFIIRTITETGAYAERLFIK